MRHDSRFRFLILAILFVPTLAFAGEHWYPAQGIDGTWAFEDMWPRKGDYDFNDVVVRYRLHSFADDNGDITQMNVRMRFVARGASQASGFAIAVPAIAGVTTSATLGCNNASINPGLDTTTFVVLDDVSSVLPPGSGDCLFSNTSPDCVDTTEGQEVLLKLHFNPPVARATIETGINPFIFRVANPGQEVHLPGYPPTAAADPALFATGDDATAVDGNHAPTGHYYLTNDELPWV